MKKFADFLKEEPQANGESAPPVKGKPQDAKDKKKKLPLPNKKVPPQGAEQNVAGQDNVKGEPNQPQVDPKSMPKKPSDLEPDNQDKVNLNGPKTKVITKPKLEVKDPPTPQLEAHLNRKHVVKNTHRFKVVQKILDKANKGKVGNTNEGQVIDKSNEFREKQADSRYNRMKGKASSPMSSKVLKLATKGKVGNTNEGVDKQEIGYLSRQRQAMQYRAAAKNAQAHLGKYDVNTKRKPQQMKNVHEKMTHSKAKTLIDKFWKGKRVGDKKLDQALDHMALNRDQGPNKATKSSRLKANEGINEMSKGKIAKYIKGAHADVMKRKEAYHPDPKGARKNAYKMISRTKGIAKAADKLSEAILHLHVTYSKGPFGKQQKLTKHYKIANKENLKDVSGVNHAKQQLRLHPDHHEMIKGGWQSTHIEAHNEEFVDEKMTHEHPEGSKDNVTRRNQVHAIRKWGKVIKSLPDKKDEGKKMDLTTLRVLMEKKRTDMSPDELHRSQQTQAEGENWHKNHPVHHMNIVHHYNTATHEEKRVGHNWYADAHHTAKAIAKDTNTPMHHMAGLVANYSPQTHWFQNIHTAAHVARHKVAVGGKGSGVFASGDQKKAAHRMLSGEHYNHVLKGHKIKAFAHLIEHGGNHPDDKEHHVVVDRHAHSVASGARITDAAFGQAGLKGKKKYDQVSQAYRDAAHHLSKEHNTTIHPHQVQAVTWLARQRHNANEEKATSKKGVSNTHKKALEARKKWDAYAGEHHPSVMGHEPGVGYAEETEFFEMPLNEISVKKAHQYTMGAIKDTQKVEKQYQDAVARGDSNIDFTKMFRKVGNRAVGIKKAQKKIALQREALQIKNPKDLEALRPQKAGANSPVGAQLDKLAKPRVRVQAGSRPVTPPKPDNTTKPGIPHGYVLQTNPINKVQSYVHPDLGKKQTTQQAAGKPTTKLRAADILPKRKGLDPAPKPLKQPWAKPEAPKAAGPSAGPTGPKVKSGSTPPPPNSGLGGVGGPQAGTSGTGKAAPPPKTPKDSTVKTPKTPEPKSGDDKGKGKGKKKSSGGSVAGGFLKGFVGGFTKRLAREETSKTLKIIREASHSKGGGAKGGEGSAGQDTEGNDHPLIALRKAVNLRQPVPLKHKSGETTHVHPDTAKHLIQHYEGHQNNDHKIQMVNRMWHSAGEFDQVHQGKPAKAGTFGTEKEGHWSLKGVKKTA